ncbi:MAG: Lysine-tRNA ligase [Candidatus Uhrbacteria bacterium GW2011_GWE2_45_35]|uniref:Lysine--tRNA ligase n=2 Tax=Candidatus Uhriibacteriota TaxID=1752732 RepID=A0A0G1JKY2_9BACT|nr:MAG: Lysine-tRNA ligase [Candidatus Uhrbacteria bacterium GW2011_GWF2_44_350]KKU09095.1 MAG: Lysine-tRNA ligase [Candidatus Uhrbacteria bacterium GW2011_GWE2_45_35]HBR80346.1 lysine--tRNA ligase [Candidatus Uhrbacteria bacterium]HCU31287.1 lysine--tRNA ligase [Candidatus Uhrbacteria bacterium]
MNEEEVVRRERLQALRQNGINPYPAKVTRTHSVKEYMGLFEEIEKQGSVVYLTGRVRTIRVHGGLTFSHIEDGSGQIQLVLKKDHLGEDNYKTFKDTVDMGDFLEVSGRPFVTQKGEHSLAVDNYQIIAKSLLPLPEKWHGLTDQEIRYRQRYLDLVSNESVRNIFKVRSAVLTALRNFLNGHGYMEVETPVLQAIPGGAAARPFITHHNVLGADLYLRIAPELYLKRLLVGGFERVYEVARCFRNEGIDHAHNPEFTQIEGYAAYMDYQELMSLMEEMVVVAIKAAGKDPACLTFKGQELNFSTPWPRLTFRDAVLKHSGIDIENFPDVDSLSVAMKEKNLEVDPKAGYGTLLDNLYKQTARPAIIQPVYVYDYPVAVSPLVKRKDNDPRYIEMFQMVYGGGEENIKAFSELNDPLDQEARFAEQAAARASGDEEAQFSDPDYVTAMKHGMPPNAGFGIGIDRLVAMLTDSPNLKEVILFPTLRPEPPTDQE